MPEDARSRTEAEAQYRDLVRLAYFVLPGKGKRFYRLAVAQRIVDGVVGGVRRGDIARQRTRVLRRSMNPSWRLRVGLGPWLRALPAKLPDPALTKALSGLEPRTRVAYVLRHIDGLQRYEVRDQLVALRIRDPWPVIDDADAADLPRISRAEPFEPTPVRRARPRPVLPLAAATLTTALIGALIVSESGGSLLGGTPRAEARNLRLVAAAPDAWTRQPHTLDVWPARGELAADRALTGRALDTWAVERNAGLGGGTQLLFAGRVGGVPTVLLRHGDRIARYTATPARLEVFAAATDAANPVALGGGHYLLAPWDTGATTPAGRKVTVTGGVTGPVTVRTRCGRGPLLDLTGRDGARTVGEFGGIRPTVLAYRSSTATAPLKPAKAATPAKTAGPVDPAGPATAAEGAEAVAGAAPAARTARLKTSAVRLWDRLGCLLPAPARPVAEAAAWDFWTGTLPHEGGRAEWACGHLAYADGGGTAQAALLTEEEDRITGLCDPRRPYSGTWWQAPSERWYYFAASARGLTPHAAGPIRKPKVTKRLLVGTPAKPKERPSAPVTLTTKES